jgi:hypothetical protein
MGGPKVGLKKLYFALFLAHYFFFTHGAKKCQHRKVKKKLISG